MELFELESEQKLRREEAAKQLHAIADMLERNNELRFKRGGKQFTIKVPDDVELSIELEVGAESELEIEIRW